MNDRQDWTQKLKEVLSTGNKPLFINYKLQPPYNLYFYFHFEKGSISGNSFLDPYTSLEHLNKIRTTIEELQREKNRHVFYFLKIVANDPFLFVDQFLFNKIEKYVTSFYYYKSEEIYQIYFSSYININWKELLN